MLLLTRLVNVFELAIEHFRLVSYEDQERIATAENVAMKKLHIKSLADLEVDIDRLACKAKRVQFFFLAQDTEVALCHARVALSQVHSELASYV